MNDVAATPSALERLTEQPRVRDLLARSVTGGRVSHAYLFVGASGSSKAAAAEALAQCIICPDGGDATCDECVRVSHHTHPDVRWLAPGSSVGYLIDQVRDLIDDAQRAPMRAHSKVYVLNRVDLLRGPSANALLKTIEEPPEGVVFILLARTLDAVLPTIVSRCQVIPFRSIPAHQALSIVMRETGASEAESRVALAVAGSPARAREYLASPARRSVRSLVVRTLDALPASDGWDVIVAARELVEIVRVQLGEVRAAQELALDSASDFLTAKALKQVEDANRRELSAHEHSGMMEMLAAMGSLLRDVLLTLEGATDMVVNTDVTHVIGRLAAITTTEGALAALARLREAEVSLATNVSPQLTLEVLLLGIKEALTCPR